MKIEDNISLKNDHKQQISTKIIKSTHVDIDNETSTIVKNEINDSIFGIENEEKYDEELYEEIVFKDDFDEEYRKDLGVDYFGEIESLGDTNIQEYMEN